ncbi:MAG: hypothetical protein GF344_15400 [Chitinivibrionales bacterium]|nr:hypothetical protein [Chitinivibrionales bacterium]
MALNILGIRPLFVLIFVILFADRSHSVLNDPFPMGYAMENFGTIATGGGVKGRQPWVPACLPVDSGLYGFAACGVDYFDDMDNYQKREIRQGAAGGWFSLFHHVTAKASYTHFSALNIYFEQKGYLSVGTSVIPFAKASVELSGYRAGLLGIRDEREALVTVGASVWIPWSLASLFISCEDVVIEDAARPGFVPPTKLTLGMHTAAHRFGAQGVCLSIEPGEPTFFGFYIGQEIRLHRTIALSAGLSADPLMFSAGLTFVVPSFSAQTALVHHPVLGWSRGLGLEYVGRRGRTPD